MKSEIFNIIVFSTIFLAFQISTLACVRIGVPPIRVSYQDSDIVFIGKIKKIKEVKIKNDDVNFYRITLELEKNYKGINSTKVDIFMRDDSCRYEIEKGESWIVFAELDEEIGKHQVFRGYLVEKESEEIIDLLNKVSTNKLPSGMTIEINNGVNFYEYYSNLVQLDLIGENFRNSYKSDKGSFDIEDIESGKYTVRFTFDRKILLDLTYEKKFKVISQAPTIIETEIEVSKNELSFIYLDVMEVWRK